MTIRYLLSKFAGLQAWLWISWVAPVTAMAQQSPVPSLTREDVQRAVNEHLQQYEKLLSAVSTLFTITGVLLAVYLALQAVREWRSWRKSREYAKELDKKYREIISIREQIDNARLAERNYLMAEECRKEERFADAIRFYREAIRYYPYDQEYFFNCGKVLTKLKLFDETVELFEQSIESFPQTLLFRRSLAETYERMSKTDLALSAWHKLLELDRANPDYYKRIARLYRHQADHEKAFEYFEKCNDLSPDLDAFRGMIQASIELYARSKMERNPELAHVHLQKLITTLKTLHQLNPIDFKTVSEEDVQKNRYFSELCNDDSFVEAIRHFQQADKIKGTEQADHKTD
jgi:tetratricopeptide (TPR) repeat protein